MNITLPLTQGFGSQISTNWAKMIPSKIDHFEIIREYWKTSNVYHQYLGVIEIKRELRQNYSKQSRQYLVILIYKKEIGDYK